MLDAIVADDEEEEEYMHLSLNVGSGSDYPRTIRVRALVGNLIMLMLINSGSSHSFVNAYLVKRVRGEPVIVKTMAVKVANVEILYSDKVMLGMN